MGCQQQSRPLVSPRRLAADAIRNRIQALNEYLTVYRAGARGRGRRAHNVRELGHDIQRLQAWAWYLDAASRGPIWWRFLTLFGGRFGGNHRARVGQRRHQRQGMQRLSSFSVIDRAYVALMEDFQGRLLTLSLLRGGGDPDCRARLMEKVRVMERLRADLAADAGRVALVCATLALLLRCAGWFGLHPGSAQTVDS